MPWCPHLSPPLPTPQTANLASALPSPSSCNRFLCSSLHLRMLSGSCVSLSAWAMAA